MAAIPSFAMPFESVPCRIWLARESSEDVYGNKNVYYADDPDIVTECVYAPGWTENDGTASDIEEGRPYGVSSDVSFFLKKSVSADLRRAKIAAYPSDDATMYGREWLVLDYPMSKMRANTPGDYSWFVRAVAFDG